MSEQEQQPQQQPEQQAMPVFAIEKIYVKDLSVEVPNAPQVFLEREAPHIDVQINSQSAAVEEGVYQTLLTVSVTAKIGDKTAFMVEVQQGGVFRIRNVPKEAMEPMLFVACPNILFPYARESVSDAVSRAGFPPLLLQPVNFEGMYMQKIQERAHATSQQIN